MDFKKANAINPERAEPFKNIGLVKLAESEYEEAIDYFSLALENDSGLAEAYWGRGKAREALGDMEGAESDYRKAEELEPELHEKSEVM